VFSNYSPYNVPRPDRQSSLLCEVSESVRKPVDAATLVDRTIEALRRDTFLLSDAPVTSRWHRRLIHGYPTPFLGRDRLLREIEPLLSEAGIHSRGRFGGWKYEVANQDHCLMQGVEAVNHLLLGEPEVTYFQPDVVNAMPRLAVGLATKRTAGRMTRDG
jgi:hypothetical protein